MNESCIVDGCNNKIFSKKYCTAHYLRLKRYGRLELITDRSGLRKKHKSEHQSYRSMKERCLLKTCKCYQRYGGAGVKICERWLGVDGFKNFYEDMGERPNGTTLDRIDPYGDYSPNNCRWANKYIQRHNQKRELGRPVQGIYFRKDRERVKCWCANFKNNNIRLTKCFKTKEEAIKQRLEWESLYCSSDREEDSTSNEASR